MEIGPCAFEMVQVPAGSFKMGTDLTGIGWIEKNGLRPVHPVTIARPFLMQKTPVTVAQFRAFADATGYLTEAEHGVGQRCGWAPDHLYTRTRSTGATPASNMNSGMATTGYTGMISAVP